MDILAVVFGLFILTSSALVTYRWGIKPERQAKKEEARKARAEMHRQHWEKLRRRSAG